MRSIAKLLAAITIAVGATTLQCPSGDIAEAAEIKRKIRIHPIRWPTGCERGHAGFERLIDACDMHFSKKHHFAGYHFWEDQFFKPNTLTERPFERALALNELSMIEDEIKAEAAGWTEESFSVRLNTPAPRGSASRRSYCLTYDRVFTNTNFPLDKGILYRTRVKGRICALRARNFDKRLPGGQVVRVEIHETWAPSARVKPLRNFAKIANASLGSLRLED